MEEVREHRLNRAFYARQVDVMLTVFDRNARAFEGLMASLDRFDARMDSFGEKIDVFGKKIDVFGEKVDTFGATLDLQREILLRFLDRLDEGGLPQG